MYDANVTPTSQIHACVMLYEFVRRKEVMHHSFFHDEPFLRISVKLHLMFV
jgi:hypothetical protein